MKFLQNSSFRALRKIFFDFLLPYWGSVQVCPVLTT
jgi:hypothetical protein